MTDPLITGTQLSNSICSGDAKLWESLFIAADRTNSDFAARLMYMRNSGCRLVSSAKFNYIIQPIKNLWESDEFYMQEKCCLEPFIPELIKLLSALK